MSSYRMIAFCAAAVCGTAFVGYCVYFDRKRRSDPDYKKKILDRRKQAKAKEKKQGGIDLNNPAVDLNDPVAREEFLRNEMAAANEELMQGNVQECITHLVNFVAFSANPKATLMTLQQTLPPTIFDLLIQVYASLEKKATAKQQQDID